MAQTDYFCVHSAYLLVPGIPFGIELCAMRYSEVARDAETVEPLLISVKKAGEMLGLKPWTVRSLCASGELKAGKPGKEWLISPASVRDYAERITSQADAS
jgi:excisionase family DNA binding protein